MKRSLMFLMSLVLMFMFLGIAFGADVVTTQAPNLANTLYTAALASLIAVLSGLLAVLIPILARKGNDLTDSLVTYLKNLAKKIENERIQSRLDSLLNTLDTAADRIWSVAGKAKVAKNADGSITITNLEDLKNEVKSNVLPQLTTSTKDLAANVGLDIETMIKQKIQERASVLL